MAKTKDDRLARFVRRRYGKQSPAHLKKRIEAFRKTIRLRGRFHCNVKNENPMWRGNGATDNSARQRARR